MSTRETFEMMGLEWPDELLDHEAGAFVHYMIEVEASIVDLTDYAREEAVEGYDYLTHFREGDTPHVAADASLDALARREGERR